MIQHFHFGYVSKRIVNKDSETYSHTSGHSSIIHNSEKMEETCLSRDKRIKKLVYICVDISNNIGVYVHVCGILFSLKREGNCDTCYNVDEIWGHRSKWNKLLTKGQMLRDSTRMRHLRWSDSQTQKGEWWLPGAEEGENGESVFIRHSFSSARWREFRWRWL